jgi:hypothetical protein
MSGRKAFKAMDCVDKLKFAQMRNSNVTVVTCLGVPDVHG